MRPPHLPIHLNIRRTFFQCLNFVNSVSLLIASFFCRRKSVYFETYRFVRPEASPRLEKGEDEGKGLKVRPQSVPDLMNPGNHFRIKNHGGKPTAALPHGFFDEVLLGASHPTWGGAIFQMQQLLKEIPGKVRSR